MAVSVRFADWPLRAKLAVLLVTASLVPLALWAALDLQRDRAQLLDNVKSVLGARGDQIVRELDGFHLGYQRAVDRIARFPGVAEYCNEAPEQRAARQAAMLGFLATHPASDSGIRGAALIDRNGRIAVATEAPLVGLDLSDRPAAQAALKGQAVITDPFISSPGSGSQPTIGYFAPIDSGPGGSSGGSCVAVLWVKASALWETLRRSDALLGPGSFAVVFDRDGIRIAHTFSDEILFHPAAKLEPATLERLVAERRFGLRTRALLEDVRAFPEQFERARAASPDLSVFRGVAADHTPSYGVARRFAVVPWTVFYMVPEAGIAEQVAQSTRERWVRALVFLGIAAVVGLLLMATILKPIRALAQATAAVTAGDLSARVAAPRHDELGRLGTAFNTMAERIQQQSQRLEHARGELELRVRERTAELQAEVAERQRAQGRLQAQLERMQLLDQITVAIGERQDLQSIYQVAIRSLEDRLPVDFSCVLRYDAVDSTLTVIRVGARSHTLALALAMDEQSIIGIDANGLARCVRGELVYEPDTEGAAFPFPKRLARGGLRSLVAAPLRSESRVFGVLVAARHQAEAFSSGDCEFLRQLSSHVALAARQAELHGALQQAYDDLHQSQQAVMQQERLRALGQMASGIAHDINNAISPAALYTESLLERETQLSGRGREQLQTIGAAIDDVTATVARMREFYREREPQLVLQPVRLSALAQQVIDLTRARWSDMPQQRGAMIELETELAPDLPDVLGVDSEVREALINLVFNAVDAMPEGGTLTVRTQRVAPALRSRAESSVAEAPTVQVEVCDSGVGMDDETLRRCLEPFFTTKGERGTGLGLAMVYGIVQRHGAEIDIESQPGQGTCVRLIFPVPSAVPPALVAVPPEVPTERLRVLLVDDDPLLLKSLRIALELDGHSVVTANGGQAGIDVLHGALRDGETFDVVITDLGMPYTDGRKVAEAVKAAAPQLPVILLTGWGRRIVSEGDLPPHVDRVLSKPPKLRDLRAALAQLVRGGVAAPVSSPSPTSSQAS